MHYQAVNMMFANPFFRVVGQQNLAGKRMSLKTRRHAIGKGGLICCISVTPQKTNRHGWWIVKILHKSHVDSLLAENGLVK